MAIFFYGSSQIRYLNKARIHFLPASSNENLLVLAYGKATHMAIVSDRLFHCFRMLRIR